MEKFTFFSWQELPQLVYIQKVYRCVNFKNWFLNPVWWASNRRIGFHHWPYYTIMPVAHQEKLLAPRSPAECLAKLWRSHQDLLSCRFAWRSGSCCSKSSSSLTHHISSCFIINFLIVLPNFIQLFEVSWRPSCRSYIVGPTLGGILISQGGIASITLTGAVLYLADQISPWNPWRNVLHHAGSSLLGVPKLEQTWGYLGGKNRVRRDG